MVSSFFVGKPDPLLGWGFVLCECACCGLGAFALPGAYRGPIVSDFVLGTSEPLLGCAAGLLDDLPASPALDAPEQGSALSIAWTQGLVHRQREFAGTASQHLMSAQARAHCMWHMHVTSYEGDAHHSQSQHLYCY